MNARSEPLIWLQLIAVGVLPLEALLLLLLLAGSDPGPLPALERLLCWGLGGLVPALVLWRRPADVWSCCCCRPRCERDGRCSSDSVLCRRLLRSGWAWWAVQACCWDCFGGVMSMPRWLANFRRWRRAPGWWVCCWRPCCWR